MRTITPDTYTVYKFDELPEEIQAKVLEKNWDWNVDYGWWECTYEDATAIGLKITGFDLDRGSNVDAEFVWDALKVAEAILADHGEDCGTHKCARDYMLERSRLVKEQCQEDADMFCEPGNSDSYESYCEYNDDIDTTDANEEFLRDLREEYLSLLRQEYDYLTSEEAIKESLIANEYEFNINGDME